MRTLDSVFGIAGTALNSQLVRMNTTASNLANGGTVAGTEKEAFRGKRAVFKTILEGQMGGQDQTAKGGVRVMQIAQDNNGGTLGEGGGEFAGTS